MEAKNKAVWLSPSGRVYSTFIKYCETKRNEIQFWKAKEITLRYKIGLAVL